MFPAPPQVPGLSTFLFFMKKYLFTSAIALAAFLSTQAQNYNAGPMYIGCTYYDASTSNGSQIASGGNLTVNTNGVWMFNDARLTTPRTSVAQTEMIRFSGGIYNRTSGYTNGYAMADNEAAGFVLPIGQSTYAPLIINSTLAAGTSVKGAWYDAKPSNSTFIIEAGGGAGAQFDFLPGYYDLTASAAGISVKPTVPASAVAATHLLGTTDGNNFTDMGLATTNATLPAGVYQLRFANKGIILPLSITQFIASKQGRTSLLNWVVAGEQNIANYTVERSSDGRNFSAIGSQPSLGNTSIERTYTFTDLQPFNGTNYYRLKVIEKDGKVSYTSIRILNWSNAVVISLFPNPTKDNVTVTGLESGMVISLVSENGQVVKRMAAQNSTVQVSMAMLSSGAYYIQVTDKEGLLLTNQKVVKQ